MQYDLVVKNGKDKWKIWFVDYPEITSQNKDIYVRIELYHYNHSIKFNTYKTASLSGNEYHLQFKAYYSNADYLMKYLIHHAKNNISVKMH